MFLKNYQKKVIVAFKQFYEQALKDKSDIQRLPEDLQKGYNWVERTFNAIKKPYQDKSENGLNEFYPRVVLKVPTGGGKTLLAVEAIREYQNLFARKRTGLVVWIVPTETIYSQTVKKLRDKSNHLRQLLDQCSGGKTLVLEKGQRLILQDVEENLVILFVMIQSISRKNGKEALKVFQDAGGYEGFFPSDNRTDLHKELLKQFPNLDSIAPESSLFPTIKTSLGNAVRVSNPFIIIDEIHKVFSDTARETIDNLNPFMVLGLSATPKAEMNTIVNISGLELKDEEMVKLDMHILPPSSSRENDWKGMVKEIKAHRQKLEKKADAFRQKNGIYIRPIALLQVEATGKDQRGKGRVHSLDVKEYLIESGVNADEIGIKTSSQNDIEDVDVFSSHCPIRYLITKEALREGWDCSFAYILGIIPNVNSTTSITQLIGRILRQPNARKTGEKSLDESYVYYSKGDTRHMIERVSAGFRNEGLDDLISKVKLSDNDQVNPTKVTRIRKEFKKEYEFAFHLPVWLMVNNGGPKARFSYSMHIKPNINLEKFIPSKDQIQSIKASLSEENRERKAISITIDESSRTKYSEKTSGYSEEGSISADYLTRRYCEVIENPFQARSCATRHIELLETSLGHDKLQKHFSFIASILFSYLMEERRNQEEVVFLNLVNQNKLVLAVSDEKQVGFKIPESDTITVTRDPIHWKYYLFDDVEISSMTSLEQKVGDILDKQSKILWWFRNKVNRQWYSIQGWQENKIRPDFVAAKQMANGKLELVYVIESKGEHLLGNANSQYKNKVLEFMTRQNKQKKIKAYQTEQLNLFAVNEKAEFYFVDENKEEKKLRDLFK